jgi:hypothetical protein
MATEVTMRRLVACALVAVTAARPLCAQAPVPTPPPPPAASGKPLPSAGQRKADLALDDALGARAANIKGDTDPNGKPVSSTTKKGLVLIQQVYLQNLVSFRNQIAGVKARSQTQKTDLVRQLRQQAPAVRDAYIRFASSTNAFNPLKPELSLSSQKSSYEATLRQADAAAKAGNAAEAARLRQRASELPYANFVAARDAFYKALDANPLLGVKVKGSVTDGDFLFNILQNKVDHLASDESLIPILDEHLQAFSDQTSKEIVRISETDELDDLFELGSARFARAHDNAARLGPLAALFVDEARAVSEGAVAVQETWNQFKSAVTDIGLAFLTGASLLLPGIGQIAVAGVTLIQVYREGADLVVALIDQANTENAAGAIGYVHQIQAGEKVEEAAFKALLTVGLGAFDVAGGFKAARQIRVLRRGGLAVDVAAETSRAARQAETAAAVERGIATAREFGVPEQNIERLAGYIDPARPRELLGLRSQKAFEGFAAIGDLEAAALRAGADPAAVRGALDRARNARSIEGLQTLQRELGLLEADAKGFTFFVDGPDQQAFASFVGGVRPRRVRVGDILYAEDLRTALTFLGEGRTVRLTDTQLGALSELVTLPDATTLYRFSPKDGGFLRIFDDDHLATAQRLLQSPDSAAIARGEKRLFAPATSVVVGEAGDASGILNRIDGAALGARPRAGIPGDAAFFKANGLEPVKTVKVGDETFHLSKPFRGPDGRISVVAFQEGANGRIVPRTFYLSGEHGVFRVATAYDIFVREGGGLAGLIRKGPVKPVDAAGKEIAQAVARRSKFVNEGAADVTAELQGPLSRLVDERGVATLPSDVVDRAFKGHLELPDSIVDEGAEFAGFVRRADAEVPLASANPGSRIDVATGPIDQYVIDSPVYGRLEGFVFRSVDGNTTYVVLRDSQGRVFVPSVQSSGSGITPFGTRQQAYQADALNTTPMVQRSKAPNAPGTADYVDNPAFHQDPILVEGLNLPPQGAVAAGPAKMARSANPTRVPPGTAAVVGRAGARVGAKDDAGGKDGAAAGGNPAGGGNVLAGGGAMTPGVVAPVPPGAVAPVRPGPIATPPGATSSTPGLDALGKAIADLPDEPRAGAPAAGSRSNSANQTGANPQPQSGAAPPPKTVLGDYARKQITDGLREGVKGLGQEIDFDKLPITDNGDGTLSVPLPDGRKLTGRVKRDERGFGAIYYFEGQKTANTTPGQPAPGAAGSRPSPAATPTLGGKPTTSPIDKQVIDAIKEANGNPDDWRRELDGSYVNTKTGQQMKVKVANGEYTFMSTRPPSKATTTPGAAPSAASGSPTYEREGRTFRAGRDDYTPEDTVEVDGEIEDVIKETGGDLDDFPSKGDKNPDGSVTRTSKDGRIRYEARIEKGDIVIERYRRKDAQPVTPGATPVTPAADGNAAPPSDPQSRAEPKPAPPAATSEVPASFVPTDAPAPGTAMVPAGGAVAPRVTRVGGGGLVTGNTEAARQLVSDYLAANEGRLEDFKASRQDEYTTVYTGPNGRIIEAEFERGGLKITDSAPSSPPPSALGIPAFGDVPTPVSTFGSDPGDALAELFAPKLNWPGPSGQAGSAGDLVLLDASRRDAMRAYMQDPPSYALPGVAGLNLGTPMPVYQNIVIRVTVTRVPGMLPIPYKYSRILDGLRERLRGMFRPPDSVRASRSFMLFPIADRAWRDSASGQSGPAATPQLKIAHQAAACVLADEHPRLQACAAPADDADRAQVWFRSRDDEPWRTVNMRREGACFGATLPKPTASLAEFQYFIAMTTRDGAVALSSEASSPPVHRPRVVKREADCGRGLSVARVVKAGQIVMRSVKGGLGVPAGFAPEGVTTPSGAVNVSLVATGASTGAVFQLQAVNATDEPVELTADDALVVQPVQPGALKPLAATVKDTRVHVDTVMGYCADFAKPPPPPGTSYRVAEPAIQQRLRPLRHVLKAGRELADAGRLHPDSEPKGYADSVTQWAIWSQTEGWDEAAFGREFVERTKKNVVDLKKPWSKALEQAVRSAIPNRWRDITMVLDEARKAARPAARP